MTDTNRILKRNSPHRKNLVRVAFITIAYFIFIISISIFHPSHVLLATEKNSYVPLSSGQLTISYRGQFSTEEKKKMKRWLTAMSKAINSIYGEFPLNNPHIRLTRYTSSRSPVPWGQINRDDNSRVDLYVNPELSYQTILSDWTASHELSHLFLPYAGERGRWLSEGLASYYQNIARANTGLISEKLAWQKLYDGFRRGERNTLGKNESLRESSKSRRGNTMRIYWSGAAYFLIVETRLALKNSENSSLAATLKNYKYCCLPEHETVRALSLIKQLDKLSKTTIFSDAYEDIIDSDDFPDYRNAFDKLGIYIKNEQVLLSNKPNHVKLRRMIISPNS